MKQILLISISVILLLNPLCAQIIGDTTVIGTTWYDIQHNATCGRQIQVDNDDYVHISWMKGLDNSGVLRHIYYQLIDPDGYLAIPGGVQVDDAVRAGYTTLVVGDDGRAFPIFHQGNPTNISHSAAAWDTLPRFGFFQTIELPDVPGGWEIEVIWPKSAIDINGRIHIVSTENPTMWDYQRHFYGWAEYDENYSCLVTCLEQEFIDHSLLISADIAASPVSNRVAIGWNKMAVSGGDTNSYDNDQIICISEDGLTWDWTDTINVTHWITPDTTLLPDTAAANKDTLRCYPDMCLMFDYNDVLHVFFTTIGNWRVQGTITYGNSFIWHWDEEGQVFSMVANGWFDEDFMSPGAWNRYAQRPSASVDPATGDIYVMYQRYVEPVDSSSMYPFPYLTGDFSDTSAAGYPNGEIWVTKSTDGGISWSEGINITNSHSPGAGPGDCLSELTPCMAPQITNGNLHIFYVLDTDAGAVVQVEGTWTLSNVMYHKVPVDEIPETPLLPPYPMHIDSTGMPPSVYVEEFTSGNIPKGFELHPPYPNPFNPTTAISFQLLAISNVNLTIYDITGREVVKLVDGYEVKGLHEVTFDAKDLTSGVYFARLTAGEFKQTRKILLVK